MRKQEIYRIIREYFKDKPVREVSVVGSYAKGEEDGESDIDILIDPKHPLGLMQLSRYKQDLKDLLKLNVDLGTKKGVSKHIVSEVNESTSIIYEA